MKNTPQLPYLRITVVQAYAVLLGALFILLAIFGVRTFYPDPYYLADFGVFFLSGYSASRGGDPYSSTYLSEVQALYNIRLSFPNLNPPFVVLLCEILSLVDPVKAFRWWTCLSILILSCIFLLLIKKSPQSPRVLGLLWALGAAPLWATLGLGQIYAPLLILVASAYHFLRKTRWKMAGVMIGLLVAVKPNFLIAVLLFLLMGYGKLCIAALTVASALTALPLLLCGPVIYQQWLAVSLSVGNSYAPTCLSPIAFVALGLLDSLLLHHVFSILVCMFSVCLGMKKRLYPELLMDLGLATTLFITPISWVGYTLFMFPAFFSRKSDWLLLVSALLLCVPAHLIWSFSASSHPLAQMVGAIYPTAWLFVSARIVRDFLCYPSSDLQVAPVPHT